MGIVNATRRWWVAGGDATRRWWVAGGDATRRWWVAGGDATRRWWVAGGFSPWVQSVDSGPGSGPGSVRLRSGLGSGFDAEVLG